MHNLDTSTVIRSTEHNLDTYEVIRSYRAQSEYFSPYEDVSNTVSSS